MYDQYQDNTQDFTTEELEQLRQDLFGHYEQQQQQEFDLADYFFQD